MVGPDVDSDKSIPSGKLRNKRDMRDINHGALLFGQTKYCIVISIALQYPVDGGPNSRTSELRSATGDTVLVHILHIGLDSD